MEQDNIYKQLQVDWNPAAQSLGWWTSSINFTLAQTKLKMYVCPSESTDMPALGVGIAVHYYHNASTYQINALLLPNPSGAALGRSNYAGVNGATGVGLNAFWGQYEGVMTNRGFLTLGQLTVQDGTSNTLMFGEFLAANDPSLNQPGQPIIKHFAASWMGIGAGGTIAGLPHVKEPPWYCFGSRHPAVVMFTFGDCSTRGIRRGNTGTPFSPDWYALQQLAGKRDGLTQNTSTILDQ
jgi:hypothetical protein